MAAATTPAPSPPRRRWRRPHISLGMLMLLVTLCSLGSAFWWRWPFVVERTNVGEAMGREFVWKAGRSSPQPAEFRRRRPAGGMPAAGIDPFATPNSVAPTPSQASGRLDPFAAPNSNDLKRVQLPAMPPSSYHLIEQLCDRRTETVRHGWGSELIRHGIALSFDKDDRRIGEEIWNEGQLHGPFRRWFTEGPLRVEGNYELGAKHGSWVIHHQELAGEPKKPIYIKRVECWKRGIPDGRWEWFDKAGKSVRRIDFRDGLPTGPLGQQIEPRLAQLMREGKLAEDLLILLLEPVELHFVETPLKYAASTLTGVSGAKIIVDAERLVVIPRKPLAEPEVEKFEVSLGNAGKLLIPVDATEPIYRVEFETPDMSKYASPTSIFPHYRKLGDIPIDYESTEKVPLIAALVTILAPHSLVCDYRFGALCITTPDEAATWRDRTGVTEVKPPHGSMLERGWERRSTLDFVDTAVWDVFAYYREASGIPIDTSRLRAQIRQGFIPRSTLTMNLQNHPFKDAIGLTLDRTGCRCRLNGETLVIEAQPHLLPPRK